MPLTNYGAVQIKKLPDYKITDSKQKGGGHLCRLPRKSSAGVSPALGSTSGCLAGTLSFQLLLAADVDLDLLRLGFRLLGQNDLQNALLIVGLDLLRIHGRRQGESGGEAAILPLDPAEILFFLFLLELALAVHGQNIILHAHIDILLVDARDFHLE